MTAALAALLAAASAAWGAGPGDAAGRLASARRVLASVAATGCPGDATPEAAARDAAAGRLPPPAARALDSAREDLRLYFACRAYAAGSAAPCAAVSRLPARVAYSVDKSALRRPDTVQFLCESDLADMRMARAAIAGDRTAFVAACREHDEAGHRDFAAGKTGEACAILAGGAADPKEACRRLAPLWSNPLPGGFCEGELRQFDGDASRCREIDGQPAARELCLGYAAWRAARAGKPEACASSAVCRVLDGGGAAACAPLGARAMAAVCAEHYAPRALDAAEKDLDAAERRLARDSSRGPSSVESARVEDATAEGAARARLELAALRTKVSKGENR